MLELAKFMADLSGSEPQMEIKEEAFDKPLKSRSNATNVCVNYSIPKS